MIAKTTTLKQKAIYRTKRKPIITMPKITQTHDIEINPERFLNACSPAELFDVDRLIQQKRYQDKINEMLNGALDEHAEDVKKSVPELPSVAFKKAEVICEVYSADMQIIAVRLCKAYGPNTVIVKFTDIINARKNAFIDCSATTDHLIIMDAPHKKITALYNYVSEPILVNLTGKDPFYISPKINVLSNSLREFFDHGPSFNRRFDVLSILDSPILPN